jgi:uncharacterized protein YkwD
MLRGLGFAFVLLACAGCASAPPVATNLPPPPDPHSVMPALEARIFDLIQQERHQTDASAKKLALDTELADVARTKSFDMAAKNYLAHRGPDGSTTASIIMDKDADFQGLLGENIAEEHYNKQTGVDVEKFAHEFVDTWMSSPNHRDNLAFPSYDRSGVGAAVNGDSVFVTQLFATNMGLPPPDHQNPDSHKVGEYSDPKSAAAPPPGVKDGEGPAPPTVMPKPRPAE